MPVHKKWKPLYRLGNFFVTVPLPAQILWNGLSDLYFASWYRKQQAHLYKPILF